MMHETIIRRKSNGLNKTQKDLLTLKDQCILQGNIKSLMDHESELSKFLPKTS